MAQHSRQHSSNSILKQQQQHKHNKTQTNSSAHYERNSFLTLLFVAQCEKHVVNRKSILLTKVISFKSRGKELNYLCFFIGNTL